MLTFLYSRCQRRLQAATSEARQELYRERLQLRRDVMEACRSGKHSVRAAAPEMAYNMSHLPPDPESPNADLSWMSFCNVMDEVQTAVNVGQQIAALADQAQVTLEPICLHLTAFVSCTFSCHVCTCSFMQLMSSACVVSVLIQALFRSEENNHGSGAVIHIPLCCGELQKGTGPVSPDQLVDRTQSTS